MHIEEVIMYYQQIDLENKYSKEGMQKELMHYFLSQEDELFNTTINNLTEFMDIEHSYEPITLFNRGIAEEWVQRGVSMVQVFSYIMVCVAMQGRASLQAVVAKSVSIIPSEEFSPSCRLIGQLMSLIEASGYIEVSKPTRIKELRMVQLGVELPTYIAKRIGNCMYLPPMLLPVKPSTNGNAGWLTIKKSIFLNNNHHSGNAPLHWLESLNSVAFSIDLNMLQYDAVAGIDISEDQGKLDNFLSARTNTIRTIKEMLAHGNKFYFIHRFCSRYRAYAAGYALSPQGNEYRRALLCLNKKELLTDDYNF